MRVRVLEGVLESSKFLRDVGDQQESMVTIVTDVITKYLLTWVFLVGEFMYSSSSGDCNRKSITNKDTDTQFVKCT